MIEADVAELARTIGREVGLEIAAAVRARLEAPAPGLLPAEELASALRVSRNTIAKLTREGMPNCQIGGVTRYDLDEVKRWLKARSPVVERRDAEQPPRRLGRGRGR